MSTVTSTNAEHTTIKSQAADTPPVFEDNASREMVQGCWAWAQIDGTGTLSVDDSFGISSVVDSAVGIYDFNFETAMATGNYSAVAAGTRFVQTDNGAHVTTYFQILTQDIGGSLADDPALSIAVFANP